jgi:hypothetical protein
MLSPLLRWNLKLLRVVVEKVALTIAIVRAANEKQQN